MGMCNTYFTNNNNNKSVKENNGKRGQRITQTHIQHRIVRQSHSFFAYFDVKHNRLYGGDLFTIHSPLVFDLQSRSAFSTSFAGCCCCLNAALFSFYFFELVILNTNNDNSPPFQMGSHFIFDGNHANGSKPNHMSFTKFVTDTVITDSNITRLLVHFGNIVLLFSVHFLPPSSSL